MNYNHVIMTEARCSNVKLIHLEIVKLWLPLILMSNTKLCAALYIDDGVILFTFDSNFKEIGDVLSIWCIGSI